MKEPTIQRRPDPVGISSQNGPRQGQPPSQRNQQNRGPNQPEGPIPIPLPKEGLRGNNHHHESNQRPKQQPISRPPPNNPSGPQNHPPRANQPSNGGLQSSASNLRPQHVLQSIDHPKSDIYKGNQVPPHQRKPTSESNGPNKQQQPLQPQNNRQRQPVPNQQQNRPNLNVKNIPGLDLIPGYEVDIKPLEVQEMLLNNQLSESAAALVNNPSLMKQASVILPGLREHVREHVRQHLQNQMKNPSQTNQQQIPSQQQVQPQSHHNQHNQPTQPQPQHQQFPHQQPQPHQPQHLQPQHHPQHPPQHQHQQPQPQLQHQQLQHPHPQQQQPQRQPPQHQQLQHQQPQHPQHQQSHHQQPEHHQTQHQQFQQNQHNQHKQLHQSQHPHHPHILDHQQQNQKPPINLPNHQTATMNVNPHTLPHQVPNKPQHINQPTLNLNDQQNQFQGRPHPTHHQNQQSNFNHQNQIPNIQNGPNKPISNPITPKPVNADTYTQKPTDDTFYKSQGSGNYLAISGHKQSHYGVASPLASESSSFQVNRPQISNPNKNPTAAASETLPISKNGFIPIQPASSQFSPSYAEKQWANNLADNSKVVGHSGFSNVNNMQTSGSNNEYHYYSNPVDPSMEVPNFVKIVELPTSPSPIPSTTSSNIKITTTKKPQVLIVPASDSQPSNMDEFEKLAAMYPNLFPQGLDFNRIITTKRPFGKPNSKDDVVYVVVDDKNKPIGGPIKPNGEGNQFYDESKISFDELLRNPELLSALATQQGFNYESLIGAGGLGQRIPPSHHAGLPFAGNQLPGNWIKHEEVKPVNEIKIVPTVSQSKPKHNNRKPTVAPLTVTTAKPRSTTSTESSVNRRRTSTTTTTLPPVTQYEIKRTTKKPSKQSATRTTVSSTTTSTTTTTTTTPVPTTISSTSTSTTTPPPTTNSPPSSTTVATPVTSPSSLSNGSLTTDDNFFLGAQSIPQALYESIQAVIAQHLSQSGVTTSTTTPSPTSSTGSTTINYDGSTIDSLRVSNSPFSHQTLNNINSNSNNNNNNQPPAYHSYYYQPPGSNETVVYGQGWPSYQPSWYQYAFPPSPIYPSGLNFTNPLGSPYYPLGSPYPVPMYPPHHMNYQPQPIAGSSGSGSAPSGSYFDLQYVTPSDVTTSPIFKTSEYPVPSTLSPNIHDKYGLYDGYDYHVPNIHGGYEAPIGSFSTDYMRSSTSPTTSTTTTTTSTTTTTTTTTPAPQTTQKASTETATEYITERPFDILRNKGDAPQIQVYIVQGANGPQVKTKTVHPHPQHHHQKVNDSPNVKVYVIDESKEPGQSESIQDISKTDSPYGRPIGAEELDSVHEISDNNNYNYDNNNNNNYYSFSYETKPRSTTPTYPSYQTSTVKPSTEDNGASSSSAGHNHYKDIEYEDDSSYSGDSYNADNGHLPAAKVNSLQSLYNSNLYPGLRNFTDGSVPEAACTRPGLFQHPGDCNKFYECYWDKFINKFTLHLFECPVKLAFDSRIVGCSAPTDPTVCVQY